MADPLDPLRAAPARSAVLTDFDGTLSPIVEDWTAAAPLPGVRDVLESLAARYAIVGVISGRPLDYLVEHLGTRLRLAGLYGLEGMVDGERVTAGDAETWRPKIDDAVDAATARFGALVEHKGLSATVHFRTRPELEDEIRSWATTTSVRTELVLRSAKASVELHPPIAIDKGTVVEALAEGLDAVCFLGDDVGDLPAFAALEVLATRGIHAVKVGVRTAEAPHVLL
ncbi:MAG: trehalose 6-phosphate phosphatase, partial [Actinomycetota bacterium]|nr:trehalose 6-phosphate phosphatase [Actinomycetota bacterium]